MCEPCSMSSLPVCIQGADGFIISLLAGKKIISISTLQRLWSLRERVTPQLGTQTFAHSQRTFPLCLPAACCLLQGCPVASALLLLNSWVEFAILCHIASASLLLKALIVSSPIRVSYRPQLNGSLGVISDSLSTWSWSTRLLLGPHGSLSLLQHYWSPPGSTGLLKGPVDVWYTAQGSFREGRLQQSHASLEAYAFVSAHVAVSERRGRTAIKALIVEEFLSSESLLLQGLRYNIQLILCSLPAKQKHPFGSVELDPRDVKEKQHYSFPETWPQIYRGKKTLRFWLPNLEPPEWSQPRALDLSWLEYSCRTFWLYLAETQAA